MTEAQAKTHRHSPFDLTKVWPKAEYPLIEVGVMELTRWPDNYFAEVEQAAFGPSNVVPGISFSPDRMLQARLFSYNDAVRYRLGVNFYQIPVNAPKCPYMSYHRDGVMRVDGNLGGTISFNPNSAGLWGNQPEFAEPPLPVEGEAAHYDHYADDDHWEQPGNLFRLMTSAHQHVLFENTARAMGDARQHINTPRRQLSARRPGLWRRGSPCSRRRRQTDCGVTGTRSGPLLQGRDGALTS